MSAQLQTISRVTAAFASEAHAQRAVQFIGRFDDLASETSVRLVLDTNGATQLALLDVDIEPGKLSPVLSLLRGTGGIPIEPRPGGATS